MSGAIARVMLFEGVDVDVMFGEPRPRFGDLLLICGPAHPRFPPMENSGLEALADLQFDHVDDYFGVRSLADDGEPLGRQSRHGRLGEGLGNRFLRRQAPTRRLMNLSGSARPLGASISSSASVAFRFLPARPARFRVR